MRPRGTLGLASLALAVAAGAAWLRGGFEAPDAASGFAAWSDGFFIAGVLFGGAGLLAFASSDGLFDIFRYGVGKAARLVLSKERRDAYPRTFFDYRQTRRGRGYNGLGLAQIGLACVAMAALFLVLSGK